MSSLSLPEPSPAPPVSPVFIVGCQRSGTTLLRLILDSHSGISCGPETLFLEDMERIVTSDWHRLARFGFDQDYWLKAIGEFFGGVHRDYALARGKRRWIDKSPVYALHMDFIARIFPAAQFIHIVRDGRDVAVSHRQRYGYWAALRTSAKWPYYLRSVHACAARLQGEGRYLEIRYEDLVADVEAMSRKVLDFLGEEWEPHVLDFHVEHHDVGEHYYQQFKERQDAERSVSPIYRSRSGAYRRELDPLIRTVFWMSSHRELKEFGYGRQSVWRRRP